LFSLASRSSAANKLSLIMAANKLMCH